MDNRVKFRADKIKVYLFKNRFIILGFIVILSIIMIASGIVFIPKVTSQDIRDVRLSSEKVNYDKKEPGAWNITKSARWVDQGKAQITFDVDTVLKGVDNSNTDLLFVLDVSSSMNNNRLKIVRENMIELIDSLLKNDQNRVGVITFNDTSDIVSEFTNDKNVLRQKVNSIGAWGNTNYYQALVNVDSVLKKYKKEDNRECIVLFLTDGYPNKETPNEVGQYNYLKQKYPFVTINGIQYEMGTKLLEQIKNISDYQYIANSDTLNNALFEASGVSELYEKFSIVDYIGDYFDVNSIKSVKVNKGKVNFEMEGNTPKITWDLDGVLRSGLNANMTIDIDLKSEYLNKGGSYETNKKEEVIAKIGNI